MTKETNPMPAVTAAAEITDDLILDLIAEGASTFDIATLLLDAENAGCPLSDIEKELAFADYVQSVRILIRQVGGR